MKRCEGWSDSTVGVTRYDKLPVNARLYLQRIEQVTGVPIHIVSTSPDRDHTIMLRHPYLPTEFRHQLPPTPAKPALAINQE
jgi:adenylosuccinate synthase